MSLPDTAFDARQWYNPDPEYIRELVEQIGLSQRVLAPRLGVNTSTVVRWMQPSRLGRVSYAAQCLLEHLAQDPRLALEKTRYRRLTQKRLETLMDQTTETRATLAARMGRAESQLRRWKGSVSNIAFADFWLLEQIAAEARSR